VFDFDVLAQAARVHPEKRKKKQDGYGFQNASIAFVALGRAEREGAARRAAPPHAVATRLA
jgi:hypothetical protein